MGPPQFWRGCFSGVFKGSVRELLFFVHFCCRRRCSIRFIGLKFSSLFGQFLGGAVVFLPACIRGAFATFWFAARMIRPASGARCYPQFQRPGIIQAESFPAMRRVVSLLANTRLVISYYISRICACILLLGQLCFTSSRNARDING